MSGIGGELTRSVDVNFDRVIHFKKKRTGILESPFDVGYRNFCRRFNRARRLSFDAQNESDLVVLSVKLQGAIDRDL